MQKNPGVAALLSFLLLGAGQIYNEQIGKACLCWLFGGIGVVVMVVGGEQGVLIGGIVVFLAYMLSISDALNSAREINDRNNE